jgi:NAD(P)-dependent dehydrogenase (short-subunit alcohol dehydrogenase family)
MADEFLTKLTEEELKALNDFYPLGFLDMVDVVDLIAFLVSPSSKKITGKSIEIDGGSKALPA